MFGHSAPDTSMNNWKRDALQTEGLETHISAGPVAIEADNELKYLDFGLNRCLGDTPRLSPLMRTSSVEDEESANQHKARTL